MKNHRFSDDLLGDKTLLIRLNSPNVRGETIKQRAFKALD